MSYLLERLNTAEGILKQAMDAMTNRASERDVQSERSMARAVSAFNSLTDNRLSERDGWLFMAVLKIARAGTTKDGVPDDYVDGAAYMALAGESVERTRPPEV